MKTDPLRWAGFFELGEFAVRGGMIDPYADDCSMQNASLLAAGDTGPLGPLTSFRCSRFGVSMANE